MTTNPCHNRVFTPSTSTDSTYSAPSNGESLHPRSRSADDLFVPTSGGTPNRASRPRSMSDRGPDRAILLLDCQNSPLKLTAHASEIDDRNRPERPFSIVSSFTHPGSSRSFPWTTQPIEVHLHDLDSAVQSQLVEDALKLYPTTAHQFVVGDTKNLVTEGRECEKRARELHVRYLADIAKRERLLKRHVMTLRAFNGDEGARFGDSLIKAINQSDAGVSELLSLVDHTSRVERICESHWRAAATVEMRALETIREKLTAAEEKICLLEADRTQDQQRIEKLEERLRQTLHQADIEPTRRKGSLPNVVFPGLPSTSTTSASFSSSPPNPLTTGPVISCPPSNATRPPMRRLNVVNTSPRVMSTFDVSSNHSSSAASSRIQVPRLRPFNRRPGGTSVDHTRELSSRHPGTSQQFESPREAPVAPLPTPEADSGSAVNRALPAVAPQEIFIKPSRRPGLQLGQAARNLFSSNLRRKACEPVATGLSLAPPPRPSPNQFATWSHETTPRRHEPLGSLFMPSTIEEPSVQKTVLIASNHSHIGPQVPPTQSQLSPPPPPPFQTPSFKGEGGGPRGRTKWASRVESGSHGGSNLTSITLSQLGSLDIAHLLTDLAPTTPSPTLRIFNQPDPEGMRPLPPHSGSSLLA